MHENIAGFYLPEGAVSYEKSINFADVTVDDLRFKRAPSFRAITLHKINVLVETYGSVLAVCAVIGAGRETVHRWRRLNQLPQPHFMHIIDRHYFIAIETLILRKKQAQAKRAKKKFQA